MALSVVRLAGAVGPEEGDDAPLGDPQRHALQHEDHVVVDHLDVVDRQERPRRRRSPLATRLLLLRAVAHACSRASCPPRPPPPRSSGARRRASARPSRRRRSTSCRPTAGSSTGPLPSWSSQVTLIGCVKPFMPSSSSRLSVRFRFSKPQRTCSPVGGLLPYFVIAVRMASADEHRVDDAAVVERLAHVLLLAGALALVVHVLDDVLVHLEVGARRVEGRALVALGAVAGGDDVGVVGRPPVADEVVHLEADGRRFLHRHLVHHAPARHEDPVRVQPAHLQPRGLLLLARDDRRRAASARTRTSSPAPRASGWLPCRTGCCGRCGRSSCPSASRARPPARRCSG